MTWQLTVAASWAVWLLVLGEGVSGLFPDLACQEAIHRYTYSVSSTGADCALSQRVFPPTLQTNCFQCLQFADDVDPPLYAVFTTGTRQCSICLGAFAHRSTLDNLTDTCRANNTHVRLYSGSVAQCMPPWELSKAASARSCWLVLVVVLTAVWAVAKSVCRGKSRQSPTSFDPPESPEQSVHQVPGTGLSLDVFWRTELASSVWMSVLSVCSVLLAWTSQWYFHTDVFEGSNYQCAVTTAQKTWDREVLAPLTLWALGIFVLSSARALYLLDVVGAMSGHTRTCGLTATLRALYRVNPFNLGALMSLLILVTYIGDFAAKLSTTLQHHMCLSFGNGGFSPNAAPILVSVSGAYALAATAVVSHAIMMSLLWRALWHHLQATHTELSSMFPRRMSAMVLHGGTVVFVACHLLTEFVVGLYLPTLLYRAGLSNDFATLQSTSIQAMMWFMLWTLCSLVHWEMFTALAPRIGLSLDYRTSGPQKLSTLRRSRRASRDQSAVLGGKHQALEYGAIDKVNRVDDVELAPTHNKRRARHGSVLGHRTKLVVPSLDLTAEPMLLTFALFLVTTALAFFQTNPALHAGSQSVWSVVGWFFLLLVFSCRLLVALQVRLFDEASVVSCSSPSDG